MADIIDEASEWEDELRQQALRRRKPNGPSPTGHCLNAECGEKLPVGHRWCDANCRERYERQLQVRLDQMGKYYDENNDN